jgi:hypothetical protein
LISEWKILKPSSIKRKKTIEIIRLYNMYLRIFLSYLKIHTKLIHF